MTKKELLTGLFLFINMAMCFAQQLSPNEAAIVFKFHAQNDYFYEQGNKKELKRLYDFVETHKSEITSGQLPIFVNGYCASFDNTNDNLKTARIRSNRVKSALIERGLKEDNFKTTNHATAYEGNKDIVTVTIKLEEFKEETQPKPQPEKVVEEPVKEVAQQVEPTQPAKTETATQPAVASVAETIQTEGKFSIRTNLLYWAVATPNLGIEYKPAERFGILVNGLWSHWIWSGEDNHHRTWMVSPEVRYYTGANKNWFIGMEGHAAEFNFKFGDTGYQGDALGGGLTGGYKLKLSRVFDLDFSLGLGYTQLKYDTYYRSREVMVLKEGGLKKDFFGPTQAGVSLVLNLDL
ncbi:hypothetical protein FACS189440_00340 [Bacteroidia bacterium]|nr:hypothetical protein FACS189440_00340 [Bacteroidia bacterium]